MENNNQPFQEKTELQRQLGLPETLSIVINRIIGSGIFRTPAPIMLITASVSMFYGVWVLGGVATILGALCYAELVAMMPKAGGPYVFLKAAFPPVVTFLRGWAMFFVSETGAIAAVALFFSENAVSLFHTGPAKYPVALIAIAVVFMLTLFNSYGIKLSGTLQNIFGLAKIAILVLIVATAFSSGINTANFSSEAATAGPSGWAAVIAIFTAMRYSFFAYSGWEGATYVAEEVKNPSRNLPLSLFGGIGIVMLLYLLINSAYINLLGPAKMGTSTSVAVDSMQIAIGSAGALFVIIAIMVNTFSNVNTQIFVKSRTWFAMSRDQLFFRPLSKVHPRYKTPNYSLYAQAVWASVLILFSTTAKSNYEAVIDYFSFTSSVFNVLTFASVFVLRMKYPDIARPYKTFGYPITLIIVILIQLTFMIVTLITAFIPSLLGIALTATGLIYYKFYVPEESKQLKSSMS
ncbi:amino acid/polyamine/organocation transporter (APC superfamily) [Arcticibacter tournemirensis]|uniref:Amino acid permease n=1 Tax=Arcticibacter tournemirensis TaxID=699437 RepID=A0A5M9H9J3_9SPHI|nr:amino acid permease [Arcticibacter tournemirensis]KAA8483583.1 amino acid permease [Arcticibacter tournemirensis]TQM51464.1 amino acid/polyamine/organocation transporter (APC superfamily) [Arcticibacter tournemirensis]